MDYDERAAVREAFALLRGIEGAPDLRELGIFPVLQEAAGILAQLLAPWNTGLGLGQYAPAPAAGQVWRDPVSGAEFLVLRVRPFRSHDDKLCVQLSAVRSSEEEGGADALCSVAVEPHDKRDWPLHPYLHLAAGRGAPWEPYAGYRE